MNGRASQVKLPLEPPRARSRWRKALAISGWLTLLLLSISMGIFLGVRAEHNGTTLQSLLRRPVAMMRAPMQALTSGLQDANPSNDKPPVLLEGSTVMIPILMYHDIIREKEVDFDMTTRLFTKQMADLAAAEAHPISMQDLYDHLQSGKAVPDRAVVLTFDDCTLGQYTDALPVLKRYHFPATFFVQTASVGIETGKQHMSWAQLRKAEATGLITVESHTVTHPEDITLLSDAALDKEMQESRKLLETKLGHPVLFLAYPSGHCDSRVGQSAMKAGYIAAVTTDRGWAGSPAQSYFLPRFSAEQRLQDVLDVWDKRGPVEPPMPRIIPVHDAPVQMGTFEGGVTPVQWVAGGSLATEALHTRKTVGEMALAARATAALNGTFFADARVQSNGSAMVGPILASTGNFYAPDTPSDEPRIEGRPLVMVGNNRCLVLPFYTHLGHTLEDLKWIMPDVKDAFLAGGWIVHYGRAEPTAQLKAWSTRDQNDPRHRAFVGIDSDGRYILGATQDSVSTRELSAALEQMGVQEAFLLDSGFSTSLIWQNHVLVSGHSRKDVPSRPVPHALFLLGDPAPDAPPPPMGSPLAAGVNAATTEDALAADSTVGATHFGRKHRRTRI